MQTATLLHFPPRPIFRALHAFKIEHGPGAIVAVLFCVHGAHLPHPQGAADQDGGDQQPDHAVGEADT